MALVPDPTWDLVERIRRERPEISEVLTARSHVRLLLDDIAEREAEIEPNADERQASRAGEGHLVMVCRSAYLKWTADIRKKAPKFEAAIRHLLIEELRREAEQAVHSA